MRWLYWEAKGVYWQVSYAIRPYDMLADRRRWFWQPRTPCQFSRRNNMGR